VRCLVWQALLSVVAAAPADFACQVSYASCRGQNAQR
jgi:hypothetical protein